MLAGVGSLDNGMSWGGGEAGGDLCDLLGIKSGEERETAVGVLVTELG